MRVPRSIQLLLACAIGFPPAASAPGGDIPVDLHQVVVTASSSAAGSSPTGAMDGDRLTTEMSSQWKGQEHCRQWWWQVEFGAPQAVGAILQVVGSHPRNLHDAPREYVWQTSEDGRQWIDLPGTRVAGERRMYRTFRLPRAVKTRFLRMNISAAHGVAPVLREVEFYPCPTGSIEFPDWVVSISSREDPTLTSAPCEFTRLLRQCDQWRDLNVQYVWHGDVDEAFVATEPRPLCAFLSGSFLEWCQRSREPWRGIQEVLTNGHLPMWAACGGAQVLAILTEIGVDQPWDCPRCRELGSPRPPIYSHIGHTGAGTCGQYDQCIAERGKFKMRIEQPDPVLAGLPQVFEIMESHVGEIGYVPAGWQRIVTRGPGAHTVNQCLRVKDRLIYAAQFHIELPGTEQNSRRIMSNFLALAIRWGGYNPNPKRSAGRTTPTQQRASSIASPARIPLHGNPGHGSSSIEP